MDIGYCEAKKGYCKAKWLKIFPLVQKKFQKIKEKQLQKYIRVVLGKNGSEKHLFFRKMTIFSKWPNLATMQRLQALQNRHFGSKIKLSKTYEKQLQIHIRVVLCNKPLQKTPNYYSQNENFSKCPNLATMQRPQAWQNRHFSSKIKIVRNIQKNNSRSTLELLCAKNGSEKHLIFKK